MRKLYLPVIIILGLFISVIITDDNDTYYDESNLMIVNNSSFNIQSIGIYNDNSSHGVNNEDNSSLSAGDVAMFAMNPENNCKFFIEIVLSDGHIYHSQEFVRDFADPNSTIRMSIEDSEDGSFSVSDVNQNMLV